MLGILEFIANRLPQVTVDDVVSRFSASVEIRDALAFAAELQAFVHERVEAVVLPPSLELEWVEQRLARETAALHAGTRWAPAGTDIQRGRTVRQESFSQPHNLTLPEFARLADKSRQQIHRDIDARRLLALSVGPSSQKLPDWQLDPVKRQLTQTVLQKVEGIDNWTLYCALSEPLEGLGGRSPVNAVTAPSIDDVAKAVFNVLGVH